MTSLPALAEDLSDLLDFKERIIERHTLELCPYLGRIKELEDELAGEMERTHTHEIEHGKYKFYQWGSVLTHKTNRRRREKAQRQATNQYIKDMIDNPRAPLDWYDETGKRRVL